MESIITLNKYLIYFYANYEWSNIFKIYWLLASIIFFRLFTVTEICSAPLYQNVFLMTWYWSMHWRLQVLVLPLSRQFQKPAPGDQYGFSEHFRRLIFFWIFKITRHFDWIFPKVRAISYVLSTAKCDSVGKFWKLWAICIMISIFHLWDQLDRSL